MRNLFNFNSFVGFLNESEEQSKSLDKILKSRGGKGEDEKIPGYHFDNIKKIFGNSEYVTRFKIAQALKAMDMDFFPTNSKFPNPEVNRNLSQKDGMILTFYIGDPEQNKKMDQIGEDILSIVKPVVDLMDKNPEGVYGFSTLMSFQRPEIKKAKALASNLKK